MSHNNGKVIRSDARPLAIGVLEQFLRSGGQVAPEDRKLLLLLIENACMQAEMLGMSLVMAKFDEAAGREGRGAEIPPWSADTDGSVTLGGPGA